MLREGGSLSLSRGTARLYQLSLPFPLGGRKGAVRLIDWKTTFPPTQTRKRKAAEMRPSAGEDTDEPPAKKLPMVRAVAKAVVDTAGLFTLLLKRR